MKQGMGGILAIVVAFGMLGLWGCPKKAEMTAAPEAAPQETAAAAETMPAEQPAAGEMTTGAATEEGMKEAAAAGGAEMQPVYFDFDRSFIRDDARAVMRANAEWLKANPQAKVRIEGNCDERGTVEYNQALGQRRAQSAKKYLADLGISSARISLISYGKEKQTCMESTEDCWQQNRRDDFVVVQE
jgi:peptidoglycan-associated lipoprotein